MATWWFQSLNGIRRDVPQRDVYLYARVSTVEGGGDGIRDVGDDHIALDYLNNDVDPTTVDSSVASSSLLPRIKQIWSQLTLSEISGSCGDLGTFIPLFVALGRERSIHVAPALFWAGLSNVVTGYLWDLPMPVQPMKTIAAVALVGEIDRIQVTTAGVWMGILLLILGLTNAIELVNRIIPRSVVSGLQLGVGASLALRGISMVVHLSTWWVGTVEGHQLLLDCRLLALASAIVALYMMREGSKAPVGIVLFGISAIVAIVQMVMIPDDSSSSSFQLQVAPVIAWGLEGATWGDWKVGLLEGALPQLPLSTLNTVISTCCLAQSLYPQRHSNGVIPTRRQLSISVGFLNLFLCPLGAMPTCNGAGGLAGQHKFGARHGTAVIFLGLIKIFLALFCGGTILLFLDKIPAGILGVMLTISGHALALTGWTSLIDETPPAKQRQEVTIALLTMMVILGLQKTHYGALCGWVAYMIYGDGLAEVFGRGNDSGSSSRPFTHGNESGSPGSDEETERLVI